MESDDGTSSSVRDGEGLRERVAFWILVRGDRNVLAGCIVVAVVVVTVVLASVGVLAVGPDSSAATVFGSGLTSGVVTLMTVALSINQLILSRVFGSPGELSDRLDGTRELRRTVEGLAGEPSSPNDPAAFLSLIAATLSDRGAALRTAIEASDWDPPDEVTNAVQDVVDYGRTIDDRLEDQADVVDVLDVALGREYARNMTAIHRLRNEYAGSLSADVRAAFGAVDDLLESIAITRQFFKTLALQQDFAHLSRLVAYTGMVALFVAVSLTLVYRTNSVTVPAASLPVVVGLGLGAIVAPLAAFVAYVLRAATIAYRTVSVGPFVPPETR